MKKITILLLLFCLIGAFSQVKKTYDIGILIDIALPELTPLFDDLKNEITAVVGDSKKGIAKNIGFINTDVVGLFFIQNPDQNHW